MCSLENSRAESNERIARIYNPAETRRKIAEIAIFIGLLQQFYEPVKKFAEENANIQIYLKYVLSEFLQSV